jgi:L-glyceraldehyde 3-phosphate reductase
MSYIPAPKRYDTMTYNHCGKSGLKLPAISLGLWHNFGGPAPTDNMRAMCRRALDLGITHFDLANNYGPPPGSAESNFGEILRSDFAGLRDQLVISTKAGYLMWDGPYGEWGSRKYLTASLDQSLQRMGLDYVDIFYSHRFDPNTPLDETMGALDRALRSGKALYVGISSYNSRRTKEANALLKEFGHRCLIHQPSYSMLNRWVETDGLLDTLQAEGIGCIAFSPLAQGMLTNKYLAGQPADSRVKANSSLSGDLLTAENLANIRALNDIAVSRGQTLAQMAIAWVLRDPRVTTALIGASRVAQVEDCVAALRNPGFSAAELARIDQYAKDGAINLWAASSES